jgi:Flp pilus assembly protein TadB
MHDDWLDEELKRSLVHKVGQAAPDFAVVMQAAQEQHAAGRKRSRLYAVAAVVAMLMIMTAGRWSSEPRVADDEFLIAAALLEKTSWAAPSDVLLPQYRFDIYREIPAFIESTKLEEGTLL